MGIDRTDRQILRYKTIEDSCQLSGQNVWADNEGRKVGKSVPAKRCDAKRVAIVRAQPSVDGDAPRSAVWSDEAPIPRGSEIAVEEADMRLQVVWRVGGAVSGKIFRTGANESAGPKRGCVRSDWNWVGS